MLLLKSVGSPSCANCTLFWRLAMIPVHWFAYSIWRYSWLLYHHLMDHQETSFEETVFLPYIKPHKVKIYDIWWQLTSAFVIRLQISANPQTSIVPNICFCVEWFTFIEHLFHLDELSFQVTCTLLHFHSLHFFPVRPVNQTFMVVCCVTWDL